MHEAHSSKDPLAIVGHEIDQKPYLLAVANGVINLRTGELEPGNPSDFLMRAAPTQWKGFEEPCPLWKRTLSEIFSGNQDVIDCFQRVLGMALIGRVIEKKMFFLTGSHGQNGKSLIFETLSEMLEEHICNVEPELFIETGKQKNAGDATPEILELQGRRLVYASEIKAGASISLAKFKKLTGGDSLKGRGIHGKITMNFQPSHTCFILSNPLPKIAADDPAA